MNTNSFAFPIQINYSTFVNDKDWRNNIEQIGKDDRSNQMNSKHLIIQQVEQKPKNRLKREKVLLLQPLDFTGEKAVLVTKNFIKTTNEKQKTKRKLPNSKLESESNKRIKNYLKNLAELKLERELRAINDLSVECELLENPATAPQFVKPTTLNKSIIKIDKICIECYATKSEQWHNRLDGRINCHACNIQHTEQSKAKINIAFKNTQDKMNINNLLNWD